MNELVNNHQCSVAEYHLAYVHMLFWTQTTSYFVSLVRALGL